jgi:hypothetical protein
VINHKYIKQINHKQPTQYIGAAEPTSSPVHFNPLRVHLQGDLSSNTKVYISESKRVTYFIPVYTFVSKHEGEENCYQHGIEKAQSCPHAQQKGGTHTSHYCAVIRPRFIW